MDEAVGLAVTTSAITAVASLGAAGITAYYGFRVARLTSDAAKLKADLRRVYRQVAAYHELEDICAQRIAAATGVAPKSVKTELRDEVESRGVERPDLTRAQCEKRLRELDA